MLARESSNRTPCAGRYKFNMIERLSLPVFLFLLHVPTVAGASTKCEAVTSNDKGIITCKYPLDLNRTRTSFCLIQYDGDKKRTDVVTACSWEESDLLCVYEGGFHFQHPTINNEFHIQLPIKKAVGAFSCDTIPPDMSVAVEKCTFADLIETYDPGGSENVTTTMIDPCSKDTVCAQVVEKCGPVPIAFLVLLSLAIIVLTPAHIYISLKYYQLKRRTPRRHKAKLDPVTTNKITQNGTANMLDNNEVETGLVGAQKLQTHWGT